MADGQDLSLLPLNNAGGVSVPPGSPPVLPEHHPNPCLLTVEGVLLPSTTPPPSRPATCTWGLIEDDGRGGRRCVSAVPVRKFACETPLLHAERPMTYAPRSQSHLSFIGG